MSVVVVTPSPDGAEAEVLDLRQPESAYTAPYAGNGHRAQDQNGYVPSQDVDDASASAPGAEQVQSSERASAGPLAEVAGTPAAPFDPAAADLETSSPDNGGEFSSGEGGNTREAEPMLTGGVTRDEPIGAQEIGGDEGLVADAALLVPIKQSPEYRSLEGRVADPEPVDAWQEDGLHFFAFALWAAEAPGNDLAQPLAVFAMKPEEPAPVSAVVVAPGVDGEEAQITNLRAPDGADGVPGPS